MPDEHTSERWTAWETTFSGPDGMIGEVGFGVRDDPEMIAYARRIVASVNACRGVPIEALEEEQREINDLLLDRFIDV